MSLAHSSSSTTEHSNNEMKHGDEPQMTVAKDMNHGIDSDQLDLGLEEPQRWPMGKKVYASLASCGFTFAL